MAFIITLPLIIAFIILLMNVFKKKKWKEPKEEFQETHRKILQNDVQFYNELNTQEQKHFEYEVQEFLLNYKITPVSTTISDEDKVLIAASGVIPIFSFPEWKYLNLDEILVYPNTFSTDFKLEGADRNMLGMVGTGVMNKKMILSKRAILNGFASDKDGHNTAIHEFVHLIDGMDGSIDGIPELLIEKPYALPWFNLIRQEIINIHQKESALRPYGATNPSEFFAVASEFFFERPGLLQEKHPLLFQYLDKMFKPKN